MGTMKRVPQHTLINEVSGESQSLYVYEEDGNDEKYTIRRLKMTIWVEAYIWTIEKVCRSKKDITLFKTLTMMADRQNLIILGSATKFAKDNKISRVKLNDFINRLINVGFLGKEATNVYKINPFVFISNKTYISSKTTKAILQVEWTKKYGYPPDQNELDLCDDLISGSNIYGSEE